MVNFITDSRQIIPLWQECFGDSEEDIRFFLDNCSNKSCIGIVKDNSLLSMLFLVECLCAGRRCKYIYAACTSKNQRGCGYMSSLLDFSKQHFNSLCLIPADNPLIKYYKDRGFTEEIKIENILFDENDEIKEYLFEGCSLEKPLALRYSQI